MHPERASCSNQAILGQSSARLATLSSVENTALGVIEARLGKIAEANWAQNGRMGSLLECLLGPEPTSGSPAPPQAPTTGQLDRIERLVVELEAALANREALIDRLGRV